MNIPEQALEEQSFVRRSIKMTNRLVWMNWIGGAVHMSAFVLLFFGGGLGILWALIPAWFMMRSSNALTIIRSDHANLKYMLHSMEGGLYLKEAFNEFRPEVRSRLRTHYIVEQYLD